MSGELTDIENMNIFCINFMIPSNLSANKMKEEIFMQHKKALSLILAILLLSSMAAAQAFGRKPKRKSPSRPYRPSMWTGRAYRWKYTASAEATM